MDIGNDTTIASLLLYMSHGIETCGDGPFWISLQTPLAVYLAFCQIPEFLASPLAYVASTLLDMNKNIVHVHLRSRRVCVRPRRAIQLHR